MRTKSKSRPLLIAIIVLLLANIGLLGFFISGKEPGKKGRHEEKKAAIISFLKKEVGFDEHQLRQFDSLSNRHWEKASVLFDSVKNNKEARLKQLAKEGFTDSAITSVASQAAERQQSVEVQMLYHIKEIRNLCTSQQLPVFDSFFYKVFARKKEGMKKQDK